MKRNVSSRKLFPIQLFGSWSSLVHWLVDEVHICHFGIRVTIISSAHAIVPFTQSVDFIYPLCHLTYHALVYLRIAIANWCSYVFVAWYRVPDIPLYIKSSDLSIFTYCVDEWVRSIFFSAETPKSRGFFS